MLRKYEQNIRNHIEQENYFELYIEKNKDLFDKLQEDYIQTQDKLNSEIKEQVLINTKLQNDIKILTKENELQLFELNFKIDSITK